MRIGVGCVGCDLTSPARTVSAALALVPSIELQLVCVIAILGLALFAQEQLALFQRHADRALDSLALWALLLTFVYSRTSALAAPGASTTPQHWTPTVVIIALLNIAVGVCLAVALLWEPLFVRAFKAIERRRK